MIRLLAEDMRWRLRSGVAITSVVQCVEELLLNSLDAGATCIAVRVDLDHMKVQVVDNGCGLCREDVECLGRRYFTSKCHSAEDLDDLRSYGFRGEAIASMVDVSSVVEVCSKRRGTGQTVSRLFQNGKPLEVVEAESSRPSAGTTVTLHNLFCNLPVRRKCLEPVVELERIRQRVEAVSLVKPAVSFSIRNEADQSVLLQLPKAKDMRSRFCQIYGLSRGQSLREALHTEGSFTMQGLVSCQGHYNRAIQFLYVNSRLVLKTKLHKLMDFIIRRESSICRGRGGRCAADLHGIFIVNIQCHGSEYDVCLQPDKTLIEFQDWDRVMLCTERGLRSLLQRENLFLAPSKDDIDEFSQKHHYNLSCESARQLVAPQGPAPNLRSKCVHRSSDLTEAGSPSPPLKAHHQLPVISGSRDGAGTMEGGEVYDRLTPPDTSTIPVEVVVSAGPMNEQIALSAPQYPAKPRGPVPAQRRSSEKHGGGTLDRFRRHYGRGDGSEPQPCKSPEKTEAIDIPKSRAEGATALNPPAPWEYVGLQQERRLKRQTPAASGGGACPLVPSAPSPLRVDAGSPEHNHDGGTCDPSPEWLLCYEESLGKSVFINSATGLSSYSAPPGDTPAACTTVVGSNGFQYQSQTLSDRQPAGQTGRNGGLSSWYTEWKNPVYMRHPALAVDVSRVHSDAQSVRIHNILYPYRFTKEMVHSLRVLQQVDSKFIVCLMNVGQAASAGGHLLVLVDQHAAHERVRLEQLIADSFEVSEAGERRLKVSVVEPALEVHVSEEEHRLLRTRAAALRRVGLSLTFPDGGRPRVLLSEIPLCFVEREANELQRGRSPMVRKMVEDYLQEQVQLLQVPGAGHGAVPRTVLKVLASQACHGAVKFNQPLTVDECRHLMHSLAQCSLPFQCAHGRPSILPLADLQHMCPETEDPPAPNLRHLRRRQLHE
ncbi:DNA mismatch repair protein Mlh3-like isoform X2 [Bufo gargarizans]|uniref:DNA mismatch repair protein Mlh3-like isoform X2 n=1 Tax=Bufo gargarizans TaxID=30331 RepID=UPI001CF18D4C|nr:DNA mismatch repair protein Mlh3-like isoform X2 [Bufo gargarizans]